MKLRDLCRTLKIEDLDEYSKENELHDLVIPDGIMLALKKIQNEEALEETDVKSLEDGLFHIRHINNGNFHDVLVHVIYLFKRDIYDKYAKIIKEDISKVENNLFEGKPLDGLASLEKYTGIINCLKIRDIEYVNHKNNDFNCPICVHFDGEERKRTALLLINTMVYLGIFPKQPLIIADTDIQRELEEINEEINEALKSKDKGSKRPCVIFSLKHPVDARYSVTYVATDGERLLYVSKKHGRYFIASHQYSPAMDQSNLKETRIHTSKKVTTHTNSDQNCWNAFSNYVIDSTSKLFENSEFRDLESIICYLGEKRQIIAQRLNHNRDQGRTSEFGRPRYNEAPVEDVAASGGWKLLYPKIKARLTLLKDSDLFKKTKYEYDNSTDYIYPNDNGKQNSKFSISFDGDLNRIIFTYPFIRDEKEFSETYKRLQPIFEKLLAWDKTNLQDFIKDIARLSYDIYRDLPVCLGTSAIVSWLTRSIAKYKGVDLGPLQDNEEDLSLDWEAFLTFDREEYANWFLARAYISPKVLDKKLVEIDLNIALKEDGRAQLQAFKDVLQLILHSDDLNQDEKSALISNLGKINYLAIDEKELENNNSQASMLLKAILAKAAVISDRNVKVEFIMAEVMVHMKGVDQANREAMHHYAVYPLITNYPHLVLAGLKNIETKSLTDSEKQKLAKHIVLSQSFMVLNELKAKPVAGELTGLFSSNDVKPAIKALEQFHENLRTATSINDIGRLIESLPKSGRLSALKEVLWDELSDLKFSSSQVMQRP